MDGEPSLQMASVLLRRAGDPGDPTRIAAAVLDVWNDIEAVLSPLIGARGSAALYQRSLHLAARRSSCLAPLQGGLHDPVDLARLRATLAACTSVDAVAGGAALLQTFCDVLADMLGAAFADRLLQPVLGARGRAAHDAGASEALR
jgi:hypothetical protein